MSKINDRKEKLLVLAGRKKEFLRGKMKRKDIEKSLENVKKEYKNLISKRDAVLNRLQSEKAAYEATERMAEAVSKEIVFTKEKMMRAHKLLQVLDLHGADAVRVKKLEDKEDFMFSVDGRWKKPQDEESDEDDSDSDDLDLDNPETNPEGFEFKK